MKLLSIVSHKGGAGKTCTAVVIAEELARRGFRVLIVDADRQRSAGLLLGIEGPTGAVQMTQNPRLRYFCSASMPLREIPEKAEELRGLFDVAVADTPSLDDPLARIWLQQSDAALMVVPVDPMSLKTLDAAQSTVEAIHQLNPDIQILGMLPTMYDENQPASRNLMMELSARRPGMVLAPPIPLDAGLTHRASHDATGGQMHDLTRMAYSQISDRVARCLNLTDLYQPAEAPAQPGWKPEPAWKAQPAAAAAPAPAPVAAGTPTVGPVGAPFTLPDKPPVRRSKAKLMLALAAMIVLLAVVGVVVGMKFLPKPGAGKAAPKASVRVPAVSVRR